VPPGEYRVRKGDNLRSIARKSGLSVRQLMRINGINSLKAKIFVGENLRVDEAFIRFEDIMDTRIRYLGNKTTLGSTPYGEWLRDELDNRRGVGDWSGFEYEWRNLRWTDIVPSGLHAYVHVNSGRWRASDWETRAFVFDQFFRP
jgi:hypothetical protein